MTQNFNLGAYGDPGGSMPLGNFRNKLINGAMDVWQRGTSMTFSNTMGFTGDRWIAATGTNGVATISRQPPAARGQRGVRPQLHVVRADDGCVHEPVRVPARRERQEFCR